MDELQDFEISQNLSLGNCVIFIVFTMLNAVCRLSNNINDGIYHELRCRKLSILVLNCP